MLTTINNSKINEQVDELTIKNCFLHLIPTAYIKYHPLVYLRSYSIYSILILDTKRSLHLCLSWKTLPYLGANIHDNSPLSVSFSTCVVRLGEERERERVKTINGHCSIRANTGNNQRDDPWCWSTLPEFCHYQKARIFIMFVVLHYRAEYIHIHKAKNNNQTCYLKAQSGCFNLPICSLGFC